VKRFWSKVEKTNTCWLWTGSKTWGYGKIEVAGETVRAHRWAWENEHGPIPEGLLVLHSCDVPACVRPDHLFLGTHADNVADKMGKGRHGAPLGERNSFAKLTRGDVVALRTLKRLGMKAPSLASKFRICRSQVLNIVSRRSWSHVEEVRP
jgi:Autographiviridae endonuclease